MQSRLAVTYVMVHGVCARAEQCLHEWHMALAGSPSEGWGVIFGINCIGVGALCQGLLCSRQVTCAMQGQGGQHAIADGSRHARYCPGRGVKRSCFILRLSRKGYLPSATARWSSLVACARPDVAMADYSCEPLGNRHNKQ